MAERTEIIARRVKSIRDPQPASQARDLAQVMAPEGMFSPARHILTLQERIAAVQASVLTSTAALDGQVAALAEARARLGAALQSHSAVST